MNDAIQKIQSLKDAPKSKTLDTVLEEIERVLQSDISYLATFDPDGETFTMHGWSKTAMDNCAAIDQPLVYILEETGIWGDAVREQKPVIENDYKNSTRPNKKGYPEGHVPVKRHMNVPVFYNEKIAGTIGVGNKVAEYNQQDCDTLIKLADAAWKVLINKF
jgi:GAF domain-containing protein